MFQLDLSVQPHFKYLFFKRRTNGLKKAQLDQILFQKIDTPWNSKLKSESQTWKSWEHFPLISTKFQFIWECVCTHFHSLHILMCCYVQIFQFPFILGRILCFPFVSWSHTQVRVLTSFSKCWFELHVPCDHPKNISTFSMTFTLLLHTQWPIMWKCRV